MQPEIRLATGSAAERASRDELLDLLGTYDTGPWTFTGDMVIEQEAIPHSHPVLTLSTFNGGPFQLASYLHEQMHWFCADRYDTVSRLRDAELRERYPQVPTGSPEAASDEDSTYLHLIVCWLEQDALRRLLGKPAAECIAHGCAEAGVYRWVYRAVLRDFDALASLYEAHSLRIGAAPANPGD